MIMQAALPYHFRLRTLTGLSPAILGKSGEIYYIGGTDVLPSPLSPEAEAEAIAALQNPENKEARACLIEHNLRLVLIPLIRRKRLNWPPTLPAVLRTRFLCILDGTARPGWRFPSMSL